jgi:spermidine synthase
MGRLRAVDTIVARHGDLIVERDPARPTGRLLRQGEMDSSYVDLADATHLEFEYMRWARIVLRAARVRRIVHVGGAACALPRALAAEWPDGRQEVCELDADVLEMARTHMGLRRTRGLHVRHGDGREFLAGQPDGSWDAVVIDAFLGARIPRRLITAQALADAARVAPVAVVNVVDDRAHRVVHTVAAGLRTCHAQVFCLGGRVGNTIVTGSRDPLPLQRIAAEAAADRSPARLTWPIAVATLTIGTTPLRDGALDENER